LQQVENEFVKIKQEFAEEGADGEAAQVFQNHQEPTPTSHKNGEIDPNDIPF
jgi:hypothetical protein